MKYERIIKGKFISRENRSIARVLVDGEEHVAHVKASEACIESQ